MCLPAGGFDQSRGYASSDSRSIGKRGQGEFIFGERRTTVIVPHGVRWQPGERKAAQIAVVNFGSDMHRPAGPDLCSSAAENSRQRNAQFAIFHGCLF